MLNMTAMILLIVALFFFRITQAAEGQYWYNCSCGNSDAEVFQNLFDDGCCSDRVECPSKPEDLDKPENEKRKPKYLGVDVFMKVWTSKDPYLLIVHRQNFLITSVFEPSLKIRELHTGHLKKSKSDFKNSFVNKCPQPLMDDYSTIVTGFSVEVKAGKKTYIVCGDQVLEVDGTLSYTSKDTINFIQHTTDQACNTIHPVFCPPEKKDDYPLISIAVIPTQKNDQNPYIYGYYAEKRQTEDREKREYEVKAWRWENKNTPDKSGKFYGYLAEIDTFAETDTDMLGLYFTVDGNACFFKQTFSDLPNLEIEDLEVPRKPCLSFQAFIGCPTPWCFDIKIDASFSYTVPKKGKEDEIEFKVVVFKGFFYWILDDIGLPFNVPSYKYAYKIFNTPDWRAKEENVCERFTGFQNAPICLPPSVEAAFGAHVSGQQLIYIRDSDRNISTINPVETKKDIKMTKIDPITGEDKPNIQAALFDQNSETAYLFYPNEYKAYKYNSKDKPWDHQPGRSGNLQDLNIEFTSVDAGVNLRDNKAYIFSNNMYYEVTFAEGKLQVDSKRLVGIDKFFDIRKECYYNSQDEYFELLSRYERENITALDLMVNVTARPEVQQSSPKGRYTPVYIILIVLFGVAIVCAAWVAMFLYDRQAKSVQVSKRGKVEKTGKTDSMKTGKTKSTAETKSKSESKFKVQ